VVLAAIGLLAVFIGTEVFRALTAEPGHAVDYARKMAELVESRQPQDERDGWPVLQEIFEKESNVESDLRDDPSGLVVDFSSLYAPRLKPLYDDTHTWEQVDDLALRGLDGAKAAGVFDRLKELATYRRAVRPTPPGLLINLLLPECGRARQLARMNGGRMRRAHREHNEAEFVEAYEETLALGRIMCMQGTLIEHLVGIAIVAHANIQAREALTEAPLSAAGCEGLLAAMDRQLPLAPLSLALEGERLCTLDIVQWTHTDDGHGSGRLILSAYNQMSGSIGGVPAIGPGAVSGWRILNLAGLAFPSKAANIAKANEFFDLCIAYADKPPAERRAMALTPGGWVESHLSRRFVVLRWCIPALEKSVASRTQCDMDVAGTRIEAALELFNARNHRYPDSLDGLSPSVLATVPADPYPAGRFVYRLLKPEEDAVKRGDGSARPYLLYTCGADGVDNHGEQAKPYPHVALTGAPSGRGFDFVINQPKDRPDPSSGKGDDGGVGGQ
jgi:hypothetical protein